jgi:cytochrome c-type biogenesis protein CcmH
MRAWVCAILLGLAAPVHAIESAPPLPDPEMQARYEEITRELRCLVCQNESIADSSAFLAGDLRREVREMVVAGKSNDEIRDFMVARYGEWILYRPRVAPHTWLLWAAPVLLLALGLVVAARIVVRRTALYRDDPADESNA